MPAVLRSVIRKPKHKSFTASSNSASISISITISIGIGIGIGIRASTSTSPSTNASTSTSISISISINIDISISISISASVSVSVSRNHFGPRRVRPHEIGKIPADTQDAPKGGEQKAKGAKGSPQKGGGLLAYGPKKEKEAATG